MLKNENLTAMIIYLNLSNDKVLPNMRPFIFYACAKYIHWFHDKPGEFIYNTSMFIYSTYINQNSRIIVYKDA